MKTGQKDVMSFGTHNESMEKQLKPRTHNTELRNSNSGKFLETATCSLKTRAPHAGSEKKKVNKVLSIIRQGTDTKADRIIHISRTV